MLRPLVVVAALAGLAAYAIIMLNGPQGVKALEEKRREIRALEEQNADLRRDIEAKKVHIERLKNDPGTQQIEVEKRLGKVRPGVTQFRELGQRTGSEAGNSQPDPTKP